MYILRKETSRLKDNLARIELSTHTGSWTYRKSKQVVELSEGGQFIYGVDQPHLTADEIQSKHTEETKAIVSKIFTEFHTQGDRKSRYSFDFKIIRGNQKEIRHLHTLIHGDPNSDTISGTLRDLTREHLLSDKLRRRGERLQKTRDAVITSMALLAEHRDTDTGAHIIRTRNYTDILLEELGFIWQFSMKDMTLISLSSTIHDIGKVGICDSILRKRGPLTEAELNEMKKHTLYGAKVLKRTQQLLGDESFLRYALEIVESHHERWDGTGYPYGLKGEAIPRSARIMALADVYDALISKRVYKEALSHSRVLEIIRSESGSHFDPDVVDAFLRREKDFYDISQTCQDEKVNSPSLVKQGVKNV